MSLVTVPATDADLSTLTLDELAALCNAEQRTIDERLTMVKVVVDDTLSHAMRVGDILLAAQSKVEQGGWTRWLSTLTSISPAAAAQYMRIAAHRDIVEQWRASGDVIKSSHALQALREGGYGRESTWHGTPSRFSELEAAEMRSLRTSGATWDEIGEQFGCDGTTARIVVDPAARDRKRKQVKASAQRRAAAAKALAEKEKRNERNTLARNAGGIIEKAYTETRRLAATLDKALASADPPQRSAVRDALAMVHKAEDAIVAAIKVSP